MSPLVTILLSTNPSFKMFTYYLQPIKMNKCKCQMFETDLFNLSFHLYAACPSLSALFCFGNNGQVEQILLIPFYGRG